MNVKMKRITMAILSILFVCSIAITAMTFTPNNRANAMVIDQGSLVIEDSYVINERKQFPTSIVVDYADGIVEADRGVIVFPDGGTYAISEGRYFDLTSVGTYTIKYYYDSADGMVTFKDSFVVTNEIYSLSDTKTGSTITPATVETMNGKKYINLQHDITGSGNDGLIVRLKEGVKFNYAEPIDLREKSEDGLSNVITIDTRIAECFTADGTFTAGKYDYVAKRVDVTLTDCYDPTIVMTITFHSYSGTVYMRANMDNMSSQALIAPSTWERMNSAVREVLYGSQRGIVWMNSYGASVGYAHSLRDYSGNVAVRYDLETGRLYAGREQAKTGVAGGPLSGSTKLADTNKIAKTLLMDFADPVVNGGVEFRNFTTGEVFLSVQCTEYENPQNARVDILSIGNKNARELFDMSVDESGEEPVYSFSPKAYEDKKAPTMTVDFNETINNGVYVGVGETFEIPQAVAHDLNMAGGVKVNVYRAYGLPNQTNVVVKDNKFVVDRADVYYIKYSATDAFGNSTEKIIKVFGTNAPNGVVVLDKSNKIADWQSLATPILFPLGEKISTKNNYKDLKLKIEIVSDKDSILIADLKNGAEIDEFWAKETYFTLDFAGDYTVKYTYSDNAVEYNYEYDFTAVKTNKITFEKELFIPRLLLKGATYAFDTVNALSYTSGEPVVVGQAELYIKFDDGAFTKIANADKVNISASKTVQLKGVYQGVEILSDVAIVKDVNYSNNRRLDTFNYFHSPEEAFTIDESGSKLLFESTKERGDNLLQFANIIDYTNFYIAYKIESAYAFYEAVKFTLIDPYDTNNQVVIKLYKEGGGTYLNCGANTVKISDAFGSTTKKEISYVKGSQTLSFSGSSTPIIMDINFTTAKAYFDIELCGITGDAGIHIMKLNDQNLSRVTSDTKGPTAIFTKMVGVYAVGDIVTLPALEFLDVLSIVEKDSVITSFKYERKDAHTALDGTLLDGVQNDATRSYQVELDKDGRFYFNFNAEDGFGNSGGTFNILTVQDKTAPTIKFNGPIKEDVIVTIKVGQAITLDFTLSDNVTPAADLRYNIIVLDHKEAIAYGDNGKTIWFEKETTYEVSIVVVDKADNVAIKSFMVVTTKEGK